MKNIVKISKASRETAQERINRGYIQRKKVRQLGIRNERVIKVAARLQTL